MNSIQYSVFSVQHWLKSAVHHTLWEPLFTLLEQAEPRRPNLLQVLTYHRVEDVVAFQQQLLYLMANYQVVPMLDVLNAGQGGPPLPPRSVLITFDDAYRNFAHAAWPFLKQYRLPVTLFVPTAFPGHPERVFWWDRLQHALIHTSRRDELETPIGLLPLATATQRQQAYKHLGQYIRSLPHHEVAGEMDHLCDELKAIPLSNQVLSWEELRQLATEGVTLAAHTQTHPLLDRVSPEEAGAEAVDSWRDLEQEVGPTLPVFAYPGGKFSPEVVRVLRRAGFVLAFTTIRGTNDLCRADLLRLRRNNIGWRATLPVLRARMLHGSTYLNRWRPLSGTTLRMNG